MAKLTTVAGLVALFAVPLLADAEVLYRLKAFGKLPDTQISEAYGLNDSGVVVGRTNFVPFIWYDCEFEALDNRNGEAWAINNNGQIVGDLWGPPRAVMWDGDRSYAVVDPPYEYGKARDINESGVIVGEMALEGKLRGFIAAGDDLIDLWEYRNDNGHTEAMAVNDLGQVVFHNRNTNDAFLWEDGTVRELNGLSRTFDINNGGVVVGQNGLAAAVYQSGEATTLPLLGRLKWTSAIAINESGVIVGESYEDNSGDGFAAIWIDGVGYDLNDLAIPEPGKLPFHLRAATDINEHGQIVGYGQTDRLDGTFSNPEAFILTPINSPAIVMGDMDGNGILDAFDVDDFELALADRAAYLLKHPEIIPYAWGDTNFDTCLDSFDIGPFEKLLAGGGASVPEPGMLGVLSIALMTSGMIRSPRRRDLNDR